MKKNYLMTVVASAAIAVLVSLAVSCGGGKRGGAHGDGQNGAPDSTAEGGGTAASASIMEDETTGTVVPDFAATDLEGRRFRLSDFKGRKVVVLDFWGSWCRWCMAGVPDMKAAWERHRDRVEMIGVNVGDDRATALRTVGENGMAWRQVMNADAGDLEDAYEVEGFPTKVIIGLDGRVVRTVVGEDPEFYEVLDALLK